MKIWKLIFAVPLLFVDVFAHAGTPLYSTRVDRMLDSMLNSTGKFTSLKFADGTTQTTAGGSGNVSYPINLAGGTETTGILPQTQGGWGTDTTGTIGVVAGRIGIGTTTPSTALHIIGTVTATGFSGNGAGLTNLVKQVSGTSTGMTADNIAITGTNSTATFKDVTVTGTFESGSQWTTTGSSSVATGVGYNQTHTINGTQAAWIGTGTGKFDVSGLQGGATVGTLTYTSRNNYNLYFATSSGSSSVAGTTTETILASIPVPAGFMSETGTFEVYSNWSNTAAGSSTAKTLRLRYGTSSTIAATTMASATHNASSGVESFYTVFGNDGSTSSQWGQNTMNLTAVGAGGGTVITSTYDTVANITYILLTGTLGTTSDNLSVRYKIKYNE